VALEEKAESEINLSDAKRIIAAGRGFIAEEDLSLARDLAQRIGAEIGCTRPLTEIETWLPKELYIGVSGLMLTPELYVGIGTSGQMQHMVGVNSAKVIVAINKDKNAPIFKQTDIGLVGDLYRVLPKVNAALDTLL
jgi:electron transfer flavoprotein alpha subunit